MLKQKRLGLDAAHQGMDIFQSIPIRYLPVNFENAISIAHANSLYAYDAYFIDCAIRYSAPLLTIDRKLKRVAEKIGIEVIEV